MDVPLVRHQAKRRRGNDRPALKSQLHGDRRRIASDHVSWARREDLEPRRRRRPAQGWASTEEEGKGGRDAEAPERNCAEADRRRPTEGTRGMREQQIRAVRCAGRDEEESRRDERCWAREAGVADQAGTATHHTPVATRTRAILLITSRRIFLNPVGQTRETPNPHDGAAAAGRSGGPSRKRRRATDTG